VVVAGGSTSLLPRPHPYPYCEPDRNSQTLTLTPMRLSASMKV